MKLEATTDRDLLQLAAFKMAEMLSFGVFDVSHRANFERALLRIKEHLNG